MEEKNWNKYELFTLLFSLYNNREFPLNVISSMVFFGASHGWDTGVIEVAEVGRVQVVG